MIRHFKNILVFLLACLGACLQYSCSTDINLYPDNWETEYIVHCIIDCQNDKQNAFIQLTSNPLDPESRNSNINDLFYNEHQLIIQEWYQDEYAEYLMDPVSIFQEDIPSSPSSALFSASFNPYMFMDYKLVLKNQQSGRILTAKTKPVPDPIVLQPHSLGTFYNFSDIDHPFTVKYKAIPRGYVYRIGFKIKYVELTESQDTLYKTATFEMNPVYVDDPPAYVPTREVEGKLITKDMPLDYLLNIHARCIPELKNLKLRWLHSFDFTIWAGNEDLKKYLQIAENFSDNRKQFFSNINNGYGLFGAANYITITDVAADDGFLKSLSSSERTSHLKFVKYPFNGPFRTEGMENNAINLNMLNINN